MWRKMKNGTEIEAKPAFKSEPPLFARTSLSGLNTENPLHITDPKEYKMDLGEGDRIAEFRTFSKSGSDTHSLRFITGLQERIEFCVEFIV